MENLSPEKSPNNEIEDKMHELREILQGISNDELAKFMIVFDKAREIEVLNGRLPENLKNQLEVYAVALPMMIKEEIGERAESK